jgi:glutamate synthase domain-containing protein 2
MSTLDEDASETRPITIGEGFCRKPYKAKSIFNISGMSFGAISKNGISSLSIAKKYWRKNSPKLEKILRKCPTTG